MATKGTLSNYLENQLINHFLRNIVYPAPANIWAALYTASPSDTKQGTEVSGGGYTRIPASFSITGNTATNLKIEFPEATGAWGTVVSISIMDNSTGGNILFWGEIINPTAIDIGENYFINEGFLEISLSGGTKGGWGDGIPAAILNHVLKNTTMLFPGDNVYVTCGSSLVVDDEYTFVSWNETSGTAYSRKKVSGTSWYGPTSGSTTNLNDVVFKAPPITGDWDRITHIAIFNASTSGDVLMWGKLYSPIYITNGDGLKFEAGNIDITLD
jgi:hypothetical protein